MKNSTSLFGLVLLLTWVDSPGRAQEKPVAEKEQLQRLANLGKLWGTIRFQHPYLAYKEIDWDGALVKALPKVEAAKTADEFAAAVQIMLDELKDPATRVMRRSAPAKSAAAPAQDAKTKSGDTKWFTSLADGVLTIDVSAIPDLRRVRGPLAQFSELRTEIAKSSGVIFDCRRAPYVSPEVQQMVLRLACTKEARAIGSRSVVHSGYRPQRRTSSGGYYSALESTFSDTFTPLPKHQAPTSVFLVGENMGVPDIALAMQYAGDSFIVVQGEAREDAVVPQRALPLVAGHQVLIRLAELIAPEGGSYSFQPDAEVPADGEPGTEGPAYKSALRLLKDGKSTRQAEAWKAFLRGEAWKAFKNLPPAVWRPDKTYADVKYPDRAHRLLALFRFWNVIHYFYPYKQLLDRDWDTVLPEFLPKFLAARDEREYVLTVWEMATRVQDNHTFVGGSTILNQYLGESPAPIGLRWIESAPVVTRLRDEKAAKDAGIEVGDVVVKVDGEVVAERMERFGKYLPSSTPHAHKASIVALLLNGAEGSTCKLTLRGADGKEREVEVPRRGAFARTPPPPPGRSEVIEVLAGNLGYVDLTRLERTQIDSMLEKLKETKGIIFDLRGYPQGVFWVLAPRFNVKNAKHAAMFQRPLVGARGGTEGSYSFLQPIDSTNKWKYTGKTVTLIDERAISQSEHTGLFLEAACGTTFIGSHTVGANGDVTDMVLPGGLSVGFGGHDVRHADGRQLQRIGLVPHIEVKPTIKGIRAGKDEVLDRAIQFLQEGK